MGECSPRRTVNFSEIANDNNACVSEWSKWVTHIGSKWISYIDLAKMRTNAQWLECENTWDGKYTLSHILTVIKYNYVVVAVIYTFAFSFVSWQSSLTLPLLNNLTFFSSSSFAIETTPGANNTKQQSASSFTFFLCFCISFSFSCQINNTNSRVHVIVREQRDWNCKRNVCELAGWLAGLRTHLIYCLPFRR